MNGAAVAHRVKRHLNCLFVTEYFYGVVLEL